jgi:hypothetical protein
MKNESEKAIQTARFLGRREQRKAWLKECGRKQIEARQQFCREAAALGAIQRHQIPEYPMKKVDYIAFEGGIAMQEISRPHQPITVFHPVMAAEWVAGCSRRGVVAVIPNPTDKVVCFRRNGA